MGTLIIFFVPWVQKSGFHFQPSLAFFCITSLLVQFYLLKTHSVHHVQRLHLVEKIMKDVSQRFVVPKTSLEDKVVSSSVQETNQIVGIFLVCLVIQKWQGLISVMHVYTLLIT